MDQTEREKILIQSKDFFKKRVAKNHIRNTKKLSDIKEFNLNPFTLRYLANYAFCESTPRNMAKALLYPRILGTSIATTFGTQLQFFCNEVLSSYASTTPGIDIEFEDNLDGRKKYCQVKSGPNTINHDDVTTIKNHFISIKNIARTNRMLDFNPMHDCIVGVFYGEKVELSASYRTIAKEYPVYIGKEFWHRLTGDEFFYRDLIAAFAEVADEMDSSELIEDVLNSLEQQIKDANI